MLSVAAREQDAAATLDSTLDAMETAENYRQWIYELARPHLDGPTLEVGAGRGTYSALLAAHGPVHAVEPSPLLASIIRSQHGGDRRIDLTIGTVDDVPSHLRFGSAVMINVLEHIEDDAAALRAINGRLVPGGTLVLWVPAFQLLFSRFDQLLGHHRRYRRAQLLRLLDACGYRVVEAKYANALGWLSWLLSARILRRVPSSPLIRAFDRYVVPVERCVEKWVRPPFGQSLFAVARKPL